MTNIHFMTFQPVDYLFFFGLFLIILSFPNFVRTGHPPFAGLVGMLTILVTMTSLIVAF